MMDQTHVGLFQRTFQGVLLPAWPAGKNIPSLISASHRTLQVLQRIQRNEN